MKKNNYHSYHEDTIGKKLAIGFILLCIAAGAYIKYQAPIKSFFTKRQPKTEKVVNPPAKSPGRLYQLVKSGDTGYKIARSHKITLKELDKYNPKIDWYKIKVGDTVYLSPKSPLEKRIK